MTFLRDLADLLKKLEGPLTDVPADEPLNIVIQVAPENRERFRRMISRALLLDQLMSDPGTDPTPDREEPEHHQDHCSYCYAGLNLLPIGSRFCTSDEETQTCPQHPFRDQRG